MVAKQLHQIDMLSHNIILEPIGRNTAPAIALEELNTLAQKTRSHHVGLDGGDHTNQEYCVVACGYQSRTQAFAAGKSLVTFLYCAH